MSRIGKNPIIIKDWVTVTIDGNHVAVKWPKWQLEYTMPNGVSAVIEDKNILVSISSDEYKNLWWLVRTLISNMVEWVSNWYEKKLVVFGVWYNVKIQWKKIVLNLWLSHQVEFNLPAAVNATQEKDSKWTDILILNSIDKQLLWEVAAKIRSLRVPEVYKGKWIRYIDEVIKLKPWKTVKK